MAQETPQQCGVSFQTTEHNFPRICVEPHKRQERITMYGKSFLVRCGQTEDRVLVSSRQMITETDESLAKRLEYMLPGSTVTPIDWPGMPDEWASFGINYKDIPQ